MTSRKIHLRTTLLAVLLGMTVALCSLTGQAMAKDYSLNETYIWATVETDGSVQVIEERTLDLDGHFHGFYWDIDTSRGEIGDVKVTVSEAGELNHQGNLQPYEYATRGDAEGTWTLDERSDHTRVDVHYDKSDEYATFYVIYELDGVAARWADTGELYWKFVGDRWDKDSHDVNCRVAFRGAPEGTQVKAGDNLRGWLHNASLSGTIEVRSGTVGPWDEWQSDAAGTLAMTLPVVREGEFAEVRAAFPAEWLPDAKELRDARLETILSEEAGWANAANKRVERADRIGAIEQWGLVGLLVANAIAALASLVGYRRSHKASFDDRYFRDVPSDDHPAILHYVYENEVGKGPDFTASLMRLSDLGVIRLEKCTFLKKRLGRSPKEKEDWRLVLVPERAKELTDPIDIATIDFTFGYVGAKARTYKDELNDHPEDTVRMSDFERVASKEEEGYEHRLELWKDVVEAQVTERGLDKDEKNDLKGPMVVLFAIDFLALAVCAAELFIFDDFLGLTGRGGTIMALGAVLLGALIALVFVVGSLPDRSAEAVELKAKLDALKRWFKDFTKLEEAVPTDVVLWDRLLVMAVMLGVSDRVIEQLKLAAPQVVDDTYLYNSMLWCDTGSSSFSPASSFSSGFSSATASASGSGGGSSSGGGGGGGGGAY